jgi:two-component system, OmpR family, sensor histidine kinase MprB
VTVPASAPSPTPSPSPVPGNPLRRFARSLSIRRRVAYLATVAVALAVAATGLAGYITLRSSLYQALDSELIEVANSLSRPVATDLRRLGGLTGDALQAGNLSLSVIRADGEIYSVPDERAHLVLGPEELAVARLQGPPSARSGYASDGREYRIMAVPLTGLGEYALVVGRPLEVINDTLTSLWLVLILFGATGVVLAAIAGSAVARSSLRPMRELAAAVEHVTLTEQLQPVVVSGSDDVTRLADAFNRMLRSLASSRERQQRLIADAGHELRTPLTSLRTNIELLAADDRTRMLTDEDRRAILADVSAQLSEFTTLIGDLVHLTRDERVSAAPEPIDLRDVVNAAVERVRRRAKGLIFDVELSPLYLVGEADDLERAVTNLLDNAVKWSPPGGTIRVHLEGDRLRVADQGQGIADADLPYIFDRFYRGEAARTTPGTGLGLSIVAQTVKRHGGWIRAGRSAQGGAEFTMRLPGVTKVEDLEATEQVPEALGQGAN